MEEFFSSNSTVDTEEVSADQIVEGVYRHYTGGLYRIHALAYDEATLTPTVVYESLIQSENSPRRSFWTRALKDFLGSVHLPNGEVVRRFSLEQNYAHWLS